MIMLVTDPDPQVIGRYALFGEIASGGMASVHYGRVSGPAGFARTVAIKRLHPHLAKEPEFVAMLLDEARLTARIRHPNVTSVIDVVVEASEVLLVMDYIHGESLSRLLRACQTTNSRPALSVISGIMVPALHGLHAAHTATSEGGEPLHIVHRDFTPQNLLIGQDGVPRIVDFGVARAVGRLQATREGQLKGKPAYMAPEQIIDDQVDARTDLFAAAVILWELLTVRRLFSASNDAAIVNRVLNRVIDPPSRVAPGIPISLDDVVMKGLARKPRDRWNSALEMAQALEVACAPATPTAVSEWVLSLAGDVLDERAATVSSVETGTPSTSLLRGQTSDGTGTALATDSGLRGGKSRKLGSRIGGVLAGMALLGVGVVIGGKSCSQTPPPRFASPAVETNLAKTTVPSASNSALSRQPNSPTADASRPESGPAEAQSPSSSVARTPLRSLPKKAPATKPAPVKSKPSANCNPPYVVDERGVVRWKRACLGKH